MLKANKSRWFERLFFVYNQNLLKRRFHTFKVLGLEKLINRNNDLPTIIYCNHSSWWDGLAAFHISQKANLDFFVMMEEKQLQNLKLFCKLGAFSVVRENPRNAIESINYSVKLLNEDSNRTLWIFPQGEILPNDLRPINFFNGVSRIIEKVGICQIFCVAMRYEFLGEYKPEIFARIDNHQNFDNKESFISKDLTKKLSKNVTDNLEKLKIDLLQNDLEKFQNLI